MNETNTNELLPISYLFEGLDGIDYNNLSVIGKVNIEALCFHLQKEITENDDKNHWMRMNESTHATVNTEISNNVSVRAEMKRQRKLVLKHLQEVAPTAPEKPEILFLRHPKMYPMTTPVMVYLMENKEDKYQLLKGWHLGIITASNSISNDDFVEFFFHKPLHSMGWVLNKHFIDQRLNSPTIMKIGDIKMLQEMIKNPQDEFMKIWKKNNRHGEDGHVYSPTNGFAKTKTIINEFHDEEYFINEVRSAYEKATKEFSTNDYRIKIFKDLIKQ
ncbi:MAG: hypothetical protein WC875_02955 [Candidatus Absconditabacterales bacterium]|jgi:hypothetical protein